MRYNDKELIQLSENKSELEGVLHYMKPQVNEWSNWYQQTSFKERLFKLVANLLFYYRINEAEPLGVLVLENVQVAYERPHKGIPFAFSLTFKINDKFRDNETKHIFSCRCDDDVNKWVSALKVHSYEYWRSQYIILKTKISMKTGQDPVLDYMRSKCSNDGEETVSKLKVTRKKEKKATFYTQLQSTTSFYTTENYSASSVTEGRATNDSGNVANLIEF